MALGAGRHGQFFMLSKMKASFNGCPVTFLFWNINRKPVEKLLAALVAEHEVDVLILAENEIPYATLVESINKDRDAIFSQVYNPLRARRPVHVFSCLPFDSVTPLLDAGGISAVRINTLTGCDIALVVAHLPSKLHMDETDDFTKCSRLARIVDEIEERIGHTRTVLVGDLNSNPFEPGLVAADALHGVMCRKVAARGKRQVDAIDRRFFYNPMWGKFGDTTPGPPGTYYYPGTGQKVLYWNIFDQVLIRPDLLPYFDDKDLKVLTHADGIPLTKVSGIPDEENASDHLPLLFRLSIEYKPVIQ